MPGRCWCWVSRSRGWIAKALAGLRRSSVAYVGQEPGLVGFLSAEENVTFTLGLRGVTGAAAVDRARESLSQVGLGPRSDQAGRPALGRRTSAAGDRLGAGTREPICCWWTSRHHGSTRPTPNRWRPCWQTRGGQQGAGGGLRDYRPLADRVRRGGGASGRRAVDGRGVRAWGGRRCWTDVALPAGRWAPMSVPSTGSPWHVPG